MIFSIYILYIFCCSVAQSCLTLCNLEDCNTPGFPVLHCLPEFVQTHVHWVSDAIQPSHPLSSTSPPALNISQHQGLFQWVGSFSVNQVFASDGQRIGFSTSSPVIQVNIQGWFPLGLTGLISSLSQELSRVFSSTPVQKHQFFSTQTSLCHYS